MEVLEPDRDVDIVVAPRDRSCIEVDRPPAEQPVGDALRLEAAADPTERDELPGTEVLRMHV
jgi:hypothetical protein